MDVCTVPLNQPQRLKLFWLNVGAAIVHIILGTVAIIIPFYLPNIQVAITYTEYEHFRLFNTTGAIDTLLAVTLTSSKFKLVALASTYSYFDALYHTYMAVRCFPYGNKSDYTNIYTRVMYLGNNPTRWLSYSISATLQFFVYSINADITNDFTLVLLSFIIFLIMYFGDIQEKWNSFINLPTYYSYKIHDDGPSGYDGKITLKNDPKQTLSNNFTYFFTKLLPLSVSGIIYLGTWAILYLNLYLRTDNVANYQQALIIGGFISFFSFGLVMLLQTLEVGYFKRNNTICWYFNVEVTYQILSFTAKVFQTSTLIIATSVYVSRNTPIIL
jgi:hypothetical protein